ncbi:hypothetical protein Tco_0655712 [Tanacetum coccineum]|uniref:Reverse transcriptase domain-containing protein n=1 Tax=Tanacetum coccineum TaxID=301880 RepID=A0ABQ4X6R5_9ASTR
MQGVSKTDFENYVKANDAVLRNMQNQGQGLQNQMTNLTEMLSKFITSNTASSSNSGTLPSQTVTNPREHVNAITTRSGLVVLSFNSTDDLIANREQVNDIVQGEKTHGLFYNGARTANIRVLTCTKPKRPKKSAWFMEKMLLTESLESGAYLDPKQLGFLADNGDTIVPVQASQEIPTLAAFQTDDLDAFDSDCDDVPSANVVLMANLSSYDVDVFLETHVALSVTDSEETLELAEESRLKMLAKQNEPSLKEKKVNIAPVDYVALNKLSEYFVKNFMPQKQLSAEQAFWLPISQPVVVKPPVLPEPVLKKEIPHELPSISMVKDSFYKMKKHVNKFDETIPFHTNNWK